MVMSSVFAHVDRKLLIRHPFLVLHSPCCTINSPLFSPSNPSPGAQGAPRARPWPRSRSRSARSPAAAGAAAATRGPGAPPPRRRGGRWPRRPAPGTLGPRRRRRRATSERRGPVDPKGPKGPKGSMNLTLGVTLKWS